MRAAILAGGRGWRLGELTERRPKALVEIGGRPILWHVMRLCAHHGLREFLVAAGYRGGEIARYFRQGQAPEAEDWSVEVVDTGIDTPTGGRIARLRERLADQPFVLAWCDGVADLDLGAMLDFHRSHGRAATLAAVHPRSRFGQLQLSDGEVTEFAEKPIRSEEWISGGFFALEPRALDWVKGEHDDWDREVLVRLCEAGELMAYRHESFWRCMDTPEEARSLEELWGNGAPWAVWR